jgi:hypothetical protein
LHLRGKIEVYEEEELKSSTSLNTHQEQGELHMQVKLILDFKVKNIESSSGKDALVSDGGSVRHNSII